MKVDPGRKLLVVDGDDMDDVRVDDLPEALPEHQPRFVLLNYRWDHGDGRVSYPLCLVFSTPRDCKTELQVTNQAGPEKSTIPVKVPFFQMMYAGSKLSLVKEAGVTKVYELRDPEELTEQWLLEQLTLRM